MLPQMSLVSFQGKFYKVNSGDRAWGGGVGNVVRETLLLTVTLLENVMPDLATVPRQNALNTYFSAR